MKAYNKKPHHLLFNRIAQIYGLFFTSQKKSFDRAITKAKPIFDIDAYESLLDVGSGTGALCSVLAQRGLRVTGVEPAVKMMEVAKRKTYGQGIEFVTANVLEGLPFESDAFDLVIASYVAHGLQPEQRQVMYREMNRVAKSYVIFHDFNQNESPVVTFVEWLEGSDYKRFIHMGKEEMKTCMGELNQCFEEVNEVEVGPQASWYICKVRKQTE